MLGRVRARWEGHKLGTSSSISETQCTDTRHSTVSTTLSNGDCVLSGRWPLHSKPPKTAIPDRYPIWLGALRLDMKDSSKRMGHPTKLAAQTSASPRGREFATPNRTSSTTTSDPVNPKPYKMYCKNHHKHALSPFFPPLPLSPAFAPRPFPPPSDKSARVSVGGLGSRFRAYYRGLNN